MGSVKKHTRNGAALAFKHNARVTKNHSNKNINSELSKNNFSLLVGRQVFQKTGDMFNLKTITPYETLKELLSNVYCYNRPKDVKVVCEWVWSCPPEIQGAENEQMYFQAVNDFLTSRYSSDGSDKHVLQSIVHMDEEYTDKNGTKKLHRHLHFCWCPIVSDEKRRQGKTECVNASKVITLKELKTIHKELEEYLHAKKINVNILTGITKIQGNMTINQIKCGHEDRKREQERSRDIERGFFTR